MSIKIEKFRKIKAGYFFLHRGNIENQIIYEIINEIMNKINFKFYNFEVFSYLEDTYNKVNILNPMFFVSNNDQIFITGHWIKKSQIIFYFLHYADTEVNFDKDKFFSIFKEIIGKYGLEVEFLSLDDFFYFGKFDQTRIDDILKIVKPYNFDRTKINLDKSFVSPFAISTVRQILSKNYSDLLLEDLKHIEILEKNNFLKVFIIFKCKTNNATIFQLKKLDNFDILLKNFRCPICGSSLSEEIRELSITTSPFLDVYFYNYIWLKNIVFDYFLSRGKIDIYEYDKDVFLIKYMNFFVLFLFCSYNDLLGFLSYYRDMEILELSHAFFFIVNYDNEKINENLFDKFKNKITFVNLTKDKLNIESFYNELQKVYEKIEFLYNLNQFSNILIEINVQKALDSKDLAQKYKDVEIEREKFIESKIEQMGNFDDLSKKSKTDHIQANELNSDESKENESQILVEELVEELVRKLPESIEEKTQEEAELIKNELELITNETDLNTDQIEMTENEVEKTIENIIFVENDKEVASDKVIDENQQIEIKVDEYEQFEIKVDESKVDESKVNENENPNELIYEMSILMEDTSNSEAISSKVKDKDLRDRSLDDLVREVNLDLKTLLEKDVELQEFRNLFHFLLLSMRKATNDKERFEAITKNIEIFQKNIKNSLFSANPDLIEYNVIILNPKSVNSFPKNGLLLLNYKQFFEAMYNESELFFGEDKEITNLILTKNGGILNFVFNSKTSLIMSLFTIKYGLTNLIIDYPADIKEFRMEIIKRVSDNLDNLVVSNVINAYTILNSEFELLVNKDKEDFFKGDVLLKVYKYYEMLRKNEVVVWSFGSKNQEFYTAFKMGNIFVILHQNNISFNQLINFYNSFYLLEVV
ncbi:MAG: hypothetical protein ACK4GJ_00630 [bacterium]